MNLSEKLAAADAGDIPDEGRLARAPRPPGRPRPTGTTAKESPGAAATDRTASSEEAWSQSKAVVQAKVLAEIAPTAADLSPDELRAKVRSTVNEILEHEDIGISPIERQRFVEEMLEDSLGYGPLEALLADRHDHRNHVQPLRRGLDRAPGQDLSAATSSSTRRTSTGASSTAWSHAVGRRVDESSPMVDARLADGSRINAIVPPLALRGPVLTIRKFPDGAPGHAGPDRAGHAQHGFRRLPRGARARARSASSSSVEPAPGRPRCSTSCPNFIPEGERLITIEESAELQIQGAHTVTLETRPSNAEGSGEVRIRDLVRNSLRMRPDRIIVGECRGAETLDMLQAMNTGHAGSMTTVHANSPRELLGRLETMVMMGGVELPQRAIREQIVMAVGVLVQLQRTA